MADLLSDMTSAELAGWLSYLQVDDEAQTQRTTLAIIKAFSNPKQRANHTDDEDEEVIDTTDPEFAKHFKGFTNTPIGRQPPRPMPMRSTEILRG